MLTASPLLAELLLLERRGADPVAVERALEEEGAFGSQLPADERSLVAAASCLVAGEPKRAERLLAGVTTGGDVGAVVGALRVAAYTLDRNWFPGGSGAVLADDVESDPPPGVASPSEQDAMLVATVAGSLVPAVLSWRSIVGNAVNTGSAAVAAASVQAFEGLGQTLQQLGHRPTVAYHALMSADLSWRAGLYDRVPQLLGAARTWAQEDLLGLAAGSLIQGDWQAEPRSSPELLGLRLEGEVLVGAAVERDVAAARSLYDDAFEAYRSAGVARGQAAVMLRLAHLAGIEGDAAAREERLGEAAELAERAGDRATVMLVRTHAAIAAIEQDRDVPAGTLDEVAAWASADGSTAFARGLCRLVGARSSAWRKEGEFVRARTALRLAERLAAGVGEPLEQELLDAAVGELYGTASYPRASFVLSDLELARRLRDAGEGSPPDALGVMQLVEGSVSLFGDAVAMRDGELIGLAAMRLRSVLAIGPSPELGPGGAVGVDVSDSSAGSAQMLAFARVQAEACLEQAGVLGPLYEANRAGLAGRPDDEAELLGRAEAALDSLGADSAGLMRCVVLHRLGRMQEALAVAVAEEEAGRLPLDFAIELYLRLGAPDRAADALARLDAAGPSPRSVKPWEDPARRLEIADELGRDDAVEHAERALAAFEQHLVRMGRDVLRSSATDDPVVAGMYLHAATARLSLAEEARERGDAAVERAQLEEAFLASDRGRAIALATVARFDDADLSADGRGAVRQWLRAGSRWAATFERLAGLVDDPSADPGELRAEARGAEAELDDAEVELARAAPDFFARRRTPPPRTDVAQLRALLPEGALLLQYHAFEDDLLSWALDTDGISAKRAEVGWRELAGRVRQFHTACAASVAVDDRGAGAELADRLLAPWADEIGEHRRVIVVTGGALAMLPFHLLPWEGDVLGAERPVSFLPAASLISRWPGVREPRLDAGALVVGDPAYGPDSGLRRLPGARTEALALGGLLGVDPLVDAAATEDAVRRGVTDAPIVHLATHGLLDERAPNSNSLALAGSDQLTVGDFLGLELSADLVVLSACHTGHSSATLGGDLLGLTRALMVAGALHVVVSLWPVDDEAGALIMHRFYERLGTGEGVAAAVAGAQADVRLLDARARADAYEKLRSAVRGEEAALGARDVDPVVPPERQATVAAHWAPFVHVGV